MKRRWKPNASQRRDYAEKMREQESMSFIKANGAIRKGCIVTWVDKISSQELSGEIINSSYGVDKNQHTFTIQFNHGGIKLVKARNLYARLTAHVQGVISKEEEKKYFAERSI